MLVDQVEIDRMRFVQHLAIVEAQRRDVTSRVDGEVLGASMLLLDDVDFNQLVIDSRFRHQHLDYLGARKLTAIQRCTSQILNDRWY